MLISIIRPGRIVPFPGCTLFQKRNFHDRTYNPERVRRRDEEQQSIYKSQRILDSALSLLGPFYVGYRNLMPSEGSWIPLHVLHSLWRTAEAGGGLTHRIGSRPSRITISPASMWFGSSISTESESTQ